MGLVDKEVVINPTRKQLQHSVLDLVITATQKHKVGELIHCLTLSVENGVVTSIQRRGKDMHQGSLSADFLHKVALSQKHKMGGSVHQHSSEEGGGAEAFSGCLRDQVEPGLKTVQ